jgi:peptide chain release factor 2
MIDRFENLYNDLEESDVLLELAIEESDQDTTEEVAQKVQGLEKQIKRLSLELMLDGEEDENNSIVSINAGAGGTEAQDWAEMLFRMYVRWIERKGFKINVVDFQPGDEAGIKSVTFTANGKYSYGYLKTEKGVHRLVRISSFASVFVYPEPDSEIVVQIDDKDLRTDVYRASGAGGQHVNKTSSVPTGKIAVQKQRNGNESA